MSNLIKHTKTELELLTKESDEYQEAINKDILELIEVFSKQEHSGFSANYVIDAFHKLANFKPLLPLTFEDEWWDLSHGTTYQHKRNSAVFKEGKDGQPYYIYAYVKVRGDDIDSYWHGSLELTNGKRVTKCYIKDVTKMPTIDIVVPVKSMGEDASDWEFLPVDESKLDELKKYYDLEFTDVEE